MSIVFRGKWFVVEQSPVVMPNGKEVVMEWVTRAAGVRVIARRANGDLLITDEYREELCRRDYRLPGGKVEGGHTPLGAARVELREETGFEAASWGYLGATQAFTMVRYPLHYFRLSCPFGGDSSGPKPRLSCYQTGSWRFVRRRRLHTA